MHALSTSTDESDTGEIGVFESEASPFPELLLVFCCSCLISVGLLLLLVVGKSAIEFIMEKKLTDLEFGRQSPN
jgi:hypothetical protein